MYQPTSTNASHCNPMVGGKPAARAGATCGLCRQHVLGVEVGGQARQLAGRHAPQAREQAVVQQLVLALRRRRLRACRGRAGRWRARRLCRPQPRQRAPRAETRPRHSLPSCAEAAGRPWRQSAAVRCRSRRKGQRVQANAPAPAAPPPASPGAAPAWPFAAPSAHDPAPASRPQPAPASGAPGPCSSGGAPAAPPAGAPPAAAPAAAPPSVGTGA